MPAPKLKIAKADVLILATSLRPKSKSLEMARIAHARLKDHNIKSTLISLRGLKLPFCDGTPRSSSSPDAEMLRRKVRKATHLIFAVPVYNWDVNAAAKNVVELLFNWGYYQEGQWEGLEGKIVGFLCAAGGHHSYMSVMSFANSLMLDCRFWVCPRYAYAVYKDFTDGKLTDKMVLERIDWLLQEMLSFRFVRSEWGPPAKVKNARKAKAAKRAKRDKRK